MNDKTLIYYFSGTGNSLKIAHVLKESIGDAEVLSIANEIKKENRIKAKKIGIVYPVYGQGPPLIVTDFIKKMNLDDVDYIFTVATMGGNSGAALKIVKKEIEKKHKVLNASYTVKMGANTNFFMNLPEVHEMLEESEQKIFLKEAENKAKIIAKNVVANKNSNDDLEKGIGSFLKEAVVYKMIFVNKIKAFDNDFYADHNCTSCGMCEKACPVKNIEIKDGKPRWKKECQACVRCFNICPQEAIHYKKATGEVMNKKYIHPEVTLKDLMNV